jgi:hypothetical protein
VEQKLADLLRRELSKRAEVSDLPKEMHAELAEGCAFPSKAEALVSKVVRLACDPQSVHEFAIELIFDRLEGRPPVSQPDSLDPLAVEERLSETTQQHLNDIAQGLLRHHPVGQPAAPAGPASRLLDLPAHGPAGAQGAGG